MLTNADLERMVSTSDEWIERTGIRERRVVGPGESTSTLSTEAGRLAIERAGLDASQIDLIILATCTRSAVSGDGLHGAGQPGHPRRRRPLILAATCSGFVYGLSVATSMIRSGAAQCAFIAADVFTHYINWNDRNTVLFGDGAGAVVLQPSEEPYGQLSCVLGASGKDEDLMAVDAGGTRLPATPELLEEGRQYVYMNGREIFKLAVRGMGDLSLQALAEAG